MSEDAELLNRYAAEQSEAAFTELTGRHVDLIYSAALRLMNGDVHSAQDVTQQVFTEVALQAKRLARHPALIGWLYTTTRLMALRMNRTNQRRQAREQEANTMNELLHDDTPAGDWQQLGPVIEDAMHELDEKDRYAVLLRYFQNKSLHEVGAALHLTENAARMRVDRAVDKLRGKLARRGITASATALAALVATNAVQSAPAAFVSTLSAAALAGGAVQASSILAATTTIAMTTLQKTIVAAALAAAVGSGIYAVRQDSQLRSQLQTLQQEKAPMAAQLQQLETERNQAAAKLAALQEENARLKSGQNSAEVLKLRGQVGTLRQLAAANQNKTEPPASGLAKMMSDPAMKEFIQHAQMEKLRAMFGDLLKELKLTPEQSDTFLRLTSEIGTKTLEALDVPGQATAGQNPGAAMQELGMQLQALLGDAGFARFQEYSQEIPARTTVTLLQDQLPENQITDEQRARLLQIIKAEPYDVTQGITGAPDQAFLGSQSDIDNFLQQVSQSNERILQQAGAFLSSNQVATLNAILTGAIESRKLQAAALIQKR